MISQKRILVINGHPFEKGLVSALAQAYCDGAHSAGHEVRCIHVGSLRFDDILNNHIFFAFKNTFFDTNTG